MQACGCACANMHRIAFKTVDFLSHEVAVPWPTFTVLLLKFVLSFAARETLPMWDRQIQSLCFQVNNIIEKISQTSPEWFAKAMENQES